LGEFIRRMDKKAGGSLAIRARAREVTALKEAQFPWVRPSGKRAGWILLVKGHASEDNLEDPHGEKGDG
jgi:hypothetical protein